MTPREPFPEYRCCSAGNRTWTIRSPHFSLLGDDHTFNVMTWTLFGEMATVLWDLITSPLPVSFRMSFNLIWINKKKDYCQLLTHKKIKLKNSPSLGMNAPDQLNKLFPSHLIHHILWTFKNKKRGKHPVFHLNWTAPAWKPPYRK